MQVSSDSTIDRQLVHRAVNDDVFITTFTEIGDQQWEAHVHIPQLHDRMPRSTTPLPTILAFEVIRQAIFVAFHKGLQIPFDWHFVTQQSSIMWHHRTPLCPGQDFNGTIIIRLVNLRRCKELPRELWFAIELIHENTVTATGTLSALALDPRAYQAIRRAALSFPKVSHQMTGSQFSSPNQGTKIVRWDDQDRFFFTRSGDHVVSMVLIDAFIAAVVSAEGSEEKIRSVDISFTKFAELDDPIYFELTQSDEQSTMGMFIQKQCHIAEGTILAT
jgi:hypothetical protein